MDKILFFDGVCVMCNGLVGFALKHDKDHAFKYAPLQGATAKERIPEFVSDQLKTVVLLDDKGIHTESDAIIRLFFQWGGVFKLAIVLKVIPKFIRDSVYRFVARNRYRWFGKTNACALLTKEQQQQILD